MLACGTPDAQLTGTGRPSKPQPGTVLEAKTRVWEEFGSFGGKAPGVDEICPEYLKSLDVVVGLSWLTRLQHCMEVGDSASGVANLGWWSLFLKRGTGECVPTTGDHTSQPPQEGLRQGTGEENSNWPIVDPQDSGGTMRFSFRPGRGTLDQLYIYPPQGA
ncbi:hypothetical protein L3Q82_014666 [Scortum barcoo]|uniref:Uncharacterized protein n=1 Tax=Scortum barcoo TaxID=214431 RepID=A0ACB8VXQ2_9TELE|nr:hypothetical protein L3Q82_014666 [Scortum barcoo]